MSSNRTVEPGGGATRLLADHEAERQAPSARLCPRRPAVEVPGTAQRLPDVLLVHPSSITRMRMNRP